MPGPFGGQGPTKLDDGCFGRIVAALGLWIVDNGSGHRGDKDDRAASALLDHLLPTRLSHQEGTCNIYVDKAAEHCDVVLFGFDVGAKQNKLRDLSISETNNPYSAMPAELIMISKEPKFSVTFMTTSRMAFASRIST